jgi:dTMP kinase
MALGKFVAIEGGDANGKQTQSKLLAEKLDALLISFPRYETEIGKLIRANLKDEWAATKHYPSVSVYSKDETANVIVRQALFTLDRYDAAPDILDALANGRNVVVDRYWLSGLIYGASDAVDAVMLERVHACLPQPDVWILLDVPIEESFRRRPERQDVYEQDREKCEGIRRRYLKRFQDEVEDTLRAKNLARHLEICPGCDLDDVLRLQMRQRWVVVDGLGTVSEVHNRIMEVIR